MLFRSLRAEALKMALSFVQRTFNVDVYEEIHRKLSEATRYGRVSETHRKPPRLELKRDLKVSP